MNAFSFLVICIFMHAYLHPPCLYISSWSFSFDALFLILSFRFFSFLIPLTRSFVSIFFPFQLLNIFFRVRCNFLLTCSRFPFSLFWKPFLTVSGSFSLSLPLSTLPSSLPTSLPSFHPLSHPFLSSLTRSSLASLICVPPFCPFLSILPLSLSLILSLVCSFCPFLSSLLSSCPFSSLTASLHQVSSRSFSPRVPHLIPLPRP